MLEIIKRVQGTKVFEVAIWLLVHEHVNGGVARRYCFPEPNPETLARLIS